MLGKKVGTVTGSATNSLEPAVGASPRFSTVGEGSGSLVGVEVQCMVKFRSEMNIDGSLYGECPNSGLLMASDGVATFRASGVGHFTETGGSSFRGAAYFQASAPSLSDLNGKAFVFHWEVDAAGSTVWDIWEWE
jgi:hypothetical protein